jgi:hypothetical protein
VEAASESVGPYPDEPVDETGGSLTLDASVAPPLADPGARPGAGARTRARAPWATRARADSRVWGGRLAADARRELLWITVIYLSARALIVIVAVLLDALGHHDLQGELAHWDGLWYRDVANNGYPRHVSYHQTNLGFFPLFPISIFLLSPVLQLVTTHDQIWASTFSGLFISAAGGLIATVFVYKLAEGWWDRATARRATVLFCVFPGAVVFSMVYSEGLLLPLAAVCIWALERRRWVLAGVMAGLGTAVQPAGLVLSVVCAVAALRELWLNGVRTGDVRRALRARNSRMAVLATVMSGAGVLSFMAFLWAWTGSPMANFIAQHHGWSEKTDELALVHLVTREAPRFDPYHFNHPLINLNDVFGFVGALLMICELWLLWRARREVSLVAIAWTLAITFLAFTSEYVPPNPRMVFTAFPMLILIARYVRGKWFALIVFLNTVMFAGLSLLTFYEHVLRP